MYPQTLLRRFIKPDLVIKEHQTLLPRISETESRYYKLPFIGKYSTHVKDRIKTIIKKFCKPETNIKLIFTSKKIGSYFSLKDRIAWEMKPNTV